MCRKPGWGDTEQVEGATRGYPEAENNSEWFELL